MDTQWSFLWNSSSTVFCQSSNLALKPRSYALVTRITPSCLCTLSVYSEAMSIHLPHLQIFQYLVDTGWPINTFQINSLYHQHLLNNCSASATVQSNHSTFEGFEQLYLSESDSWPDVGRQMGKWNNLNIKPSGRYGTSDRVSVLGLLRSGPLCLRVDDDWEQIWGKFSADLLASLRQQKAFLFSFSFFVFELSAEANLNCFL